MVLLIIVVSFQKKTLDLIKLDDEHGEFRGVPIMVDASAGSGPKSMGIKSTYVLDHVLPRRNPNFARQTTS